MTGLLWTLVFIQMLMGASDTFFHHEGTQRLAWRPSQANELRLHGVRNLAYAVLFLMLGWRVPHGLWAASLLLLMGGEMLITLWDFVEEDRTRKLPASERVLHTLLTLNYGAILSLLVPALLARARETTGLEPAFFGAMSWFCLVAAAGVIVSGIRDLVAARRCRRLGGTAPAALTAALKDRRSILVTGATGFVGTRLVAALTAAGHDVTILTRTRANADALPAPLRIVTTLAQISDDTRIDAIVNLAGEPISNSPWTRAKRLKIVRSRLEVTREILRLVRRLERTPEVLVSGSAIGWYGLRDDQPLTEVNLGTPCFSRRICVTWERWARKAQGEGVRTIMLRTGLVLDSSGGLLSRMLTPFEYGLGGRFGNGRQWMSWIHRDDLVRLIVHAIATPSLKGPLNATAPEPVTNRQFTAALGRALRRPAIVPVPAWPLRKALGGFAEELLLGGQRVLPHKAMLSGFSFTYRTIDEALLAIVGRSEAMGAGERSSYGLRLTCSPAAKHI